MLLPNAGFWRMWGVAALLGFVGILFFGNLRPAHAETCVASFYDRGVLTANGERFNPRVANTVAYPDRRMIGHHLRITELSTGRSSVFRVNDFGPARWTHHCVDFTRAGARLFGFEHRGVAHVTIEHID